MTQESAASGPAVSLVPTLVDRERQLIEAALAQTKGRISGPKGGSREAGGSAPDARRRITSLGIDKHRFKTC